MDGEHVNRDDLQHACAAEGGGAVLEESPKLLQHSTGYSRKTLHPEDQTTHIMQMNQSFPEHFPRTGLFKNVH